jgi:hypothetical protein
MDGSESVVVSRPAGDTITIKFDRAIEEDLYIKFTLTAKVAGTTFDNDYIKASLVSALLYTLGQKASIDEVFNAMAVIQPEAFVTACEVSNDGSAWGDLISATDIQHKFVLDVSRITIS